MQRANLMEQEGNDATIAAVARIVPLDLRGKKAFVGEAVGRVTAAHSGPAAAHHQAETG